MEPIANTAATAVFAFGAGIIGQIEGVSSAGIVTNGFVNPVTIVGVGLLVPIVPSQLKGLANGMMGPRGPDL